MWHIKEDILRNICYLLVGTKTGYQHSSKYHLLCSAEEGHTGLKQYQDE